MNSCRSIPTIHALHGFLGQPSDWNVLNSQLTECQLVKHDLFQSQPIEPFDAWANHFNQKIDVSSFPILLGYSMGGRLAMNALMDVPHLWKGAILVSSHLGLKTEEEKNTRYASDCEWSSRFLNESWDGLMEQWNEREMFTTASFAFKRKEEEYKREHLAKALDIWSLGKQEEMTFFLSQISLPILWVAGENDFHYCARANQLSFKNPLSRVWIAPESGHRVPWEKQDLFILEVNQFLNDLRKYYELCNTRLVGNC